MGRVLPILFNTEMVQAILSGGKCCTRRVVKHKYNNTEEKEPPYRIGDILYVRETWQYLYELDGNEQVIEDTGKYYYAATDTIPFDTYVDENGVKHDHAPWHPSIHMPKEAARIWLRVTGVRAERLQEITVDEAKKEGANLRNGKNVGWQEKWYHTAIERFEKIWDSTIKKADMEKYGWEANPWVWVIEFVPCKRPDGDG